MKNKSPVSLSKKDWISIVIIDIIALLIVLALIVGISVLIKMIVQ